MAILPSESHSSAHAPIPLLTDRAYERIKHDVITCVLAPGTEVSEPQLCLQYRLGKAPVRMALIRLAHDGLVRAIPRRGYRISPVTLKDIQDIFELRLMLEPLAARMAAGKIDTHRARALEAEMQLEQRALLKALVRGNGDSAERLAREQIEAARSMVLSAVMSSRSIMNLALNGD